MEPVLTPEPPPQVLTVPIRIVGRLLSFAVVALFAAHLASQFFEHILDRPSVKGFVPRFNMNAEMSLPTWFAVQLLFASAIMLAIIAVLHRRAGDRHAPWWAGLAVVFTYLTVDEALAIHELTIAPLRDLLGVTSGWLYFAWVIPGAAAAVILIVIYLPFLRSLPAPTRRGFAIGALCFIVGALGVETAGGWYLSTRGDDFAYEMIGAAEETLELSGSSLFLVTLLDHLAASPGPLALRFVSAAAGKSP